MTGLKEFGTISFKEASSAARHYASRGFPAHTGLIKQERYGLGDCAQSFREAWPSSSTLYLPGDALPTEGQLLRNPGYCTLLEHLVAAEDRASGDRETRLAAVYAAFYNGEPASIIDRFSREQDGLLRRSDMEVFETYIEEPAWLRFGDACVYKCGPWNQGPVLLQTLGILAARDIRGLGHNTVNYIHRITEAMNLAFADREQYFGDPRMVRVPMEQLLSSPYLQRRATLIDDMVANLELRPGDPVNGGALLPIGLRLGGTSWGSGTVHVSSIDAKGNMASATPSGAWIRSCPVIAQLGFPLSNRLMTFHLSPAAHPNVVAPLKRPRTTISPSLATRGGRPWMVFGSMGGDYQDQWQLQFFLNRHTFDMSLQEAIEAAKFSSEHFPGSFGDIARFPCRLRIEEALERQVGGALRKMGHDVQAAPDWSEGFLLAIERHAQSCVLEAGCDPRGAKSEIFACAARAF